MTDASLFLPASLTVLFGAALVVLAAGRWLGRLAGWLVLVAATTSVVMLATVARHAGTTPAFVRPWMPTLGIEFALRADGFGLFFALLVTGVGVLIALYAITYLAHEDPLAQRRFWAALPAFMGAMVGVALADDLILLFVCWEITSVTSFLLIGFYAEREEARAGAVTAFQVTALGGLVMSVGILLIGAEVGTFSLSTLAGDPGRVARLLASPVGTPALLCLLVGAFTKSAQVPFHFWLPRAMVAPTPVSAYLHAATMVKAGIFLLGRLAPIFGTAPSWMPVLVTVGGATYLIGAFEALRESDLKAILARTTIAALGGMTLLYGVGGAHVDALLMLNHALYKGPLFLVAGIVEHVTHTRDIRALGGLGRRLPVVAAVCGLAVLSMAAVPPLFGFAAKEAAVGVILHGPALAALPVIRWVVLAVVVFASACLVAVGLRLVVGVFLGPMPAPLARRLDADGHHASGGPPLVVAPFVLVCAALALSVLGATDLPGAWLAAAASQAGPPMHLALVPHGPVEFGVSLATLALGVVIWRSRWDVLAPHGEFRRVRSVGVLWDATLETVIEAGAQWSGRWQNGSLRWYLAATVCAVPTLLLLGLDRGGLSFARIQTSTADAPWYGVALCVLLGVAALNTVRARTRLAAAIWTTAVGFTVSMLFVVYRSPDILLTQILIETVSTIFVLLVLIHLPAFPVHDLTPSGRMLNAVVALAFGGVMMGVTLLAMSPGLRSLDNVATRPGGLLSLARSQGGGGNAVNVIIVDIRALDTNGEITVLVVVGLCIFALLRARRRAA